MLCEKCGKNNATTHIRSVLNGQVTELDLCGYCAAKGGYTSLSGGSLAGMLSSMFDEVLASGIPEKAKCCSCCGTNFASIAETGRVGCAGCYETFYDELLPYLKRVHGSTKHAGKTPSLAPLVVTPKAETVDDLRMQLSELVREEKYEQAAVIRDKIKKLEGGAQQ